jgi:hypothetical protein
MVSGNSAIGENDMKVELSRFRVKDGKSPRVDVWLKILNENINECIQTLDREQMKLEMIFREIINGNEFLSWVSIQGEGGEPAETSPFEIDRKHREFFEECLDHDYGRRDAQVQVIMVPGAVARSMDWQGPSTAKKQFQHREIILKRPEKRAKNSEQ